MFHRKNKRQKKSQEMLDIDLMEEIGYYQKKPQKKGLDQKIVIALVLVVVVAAGMPSALQSARVPPHSRFSSLS